MSASAFTSEGGLLAWKTILTLSIYEGLPERLSGSVFPNREVRHKARIPMPPKITLWDVEENQLTEIQSGPLDLERRLEDWLEQDISILGEDLLIIGRQVLTDFGHYIDLLGLDRNADLVVLEPPAQCSSPPPPLDRIQREHPWLIG